MLDVGGDGEIMTLLGREGHRVVEIDAEQAIELAFEDGSFDTVVLGDSLASLLNCERPIAEARRVLRPGGRLIVTFPYGGQRAEGAGLSLQTLLAGLSSFSVKEIETLDERLCVLAERAREKSRAGVWRQALGVAERRLAEREEEIGMLTASVAGLEARRENEERALADARGDVERLETALAAATHRRDREKEAARLAGDGVAQLEQRLERLRHEGEREVAEAERRRERELAQVERKLAGARARLEVREEELGRSIAAAEKYQHELNVFRERLAESERELGAANRARESRETELQRLRVAVREGERALALTEARLEKSQLRAEGFRSSLISLRQGRSYRAMRMLWRLRRPFGRAPRDAVEPSAGADDDPDSPAASRSAPSPAPATGSAPAPKSAASPPPPPRPRRPGERLRVAAILDEMSAACFAPECDLIPLTLEAWREQLDERQPDLLLVESAWNGNDGEWQYRIAKYPRKDLLGLPALRALLDGCRERGIPTAFWNKEDPVHFDRFAEAASLFDHVFTTDSLCVERYRALPGARTVTPLPFAAQPRIHNPTAVVEERSSSPCFAGAWYRDRHPDRRRSLEALLDAARPHGLVIYDRRFATDDGAFGFPERFQPHVLGSLPYDRVLDVYKSHRVFLNANSVAESPTMCSRRVFELAACDTPILSTPGAALSELFGGGLIAEAGDEAAAAQSLERLLGDADERAHRTRAARRIVFAKHTYADRLKTIAGTAGLDTSSLDRQPFALPDDLSNGAGAGAGNAGGSLKNGGDRHPWLLLTQPAARLSEPALADLRAVASFADADVIGAYPARNGERAVEHRRVPEVDPRALLVRRELVEARGRPSGSPEDVLARLRKWSDEGVRIYAADADLISTP